MKAHRRCGGVAPLVLNLGTRWRWVVNFSPPPLYPQERALVLIECKADWAPDTVRTILRREKYFACAGTWTLGRPSRRPVTIVPEKIKICLHIFKGQHSEESITWVNTSPVLCPKIRLWGSVWKTPPVAGRFVINQRATLWVHKPLVRNRL